MNYEDAIRDSMAKGAEAAKTSTARREADINGNGMYWYGKALEYKQMHEMAVQREKHLEGMLGQLRNGTKPATAPLFGPMDRKPL